MAQSKIWYNAQSHCQEMAGTLAVIDGSDIQALIESVLEVQQYGGYWIGLQQAIYHWSTGKVNTYNICA